MICVVMRCDATVNNIIRYGTIRCGTVRCVVREMGESKTSFNASKK